MLTAQHGVDDLVTFVIRINEIALVFWADVEATAVADNLIGAFGVALNEV